MTPPDEPSRGGGPDRASSIAGPHSIETMGSARYPRIGWRVLVWVDDSPWVCQALQFACRHLEPQDDLVLLAGCPRASAGCLECGRMQLDRVMKVCAGAVAEASVRLRLAVGDPHTLLTMVAAAERPDLVVAGATGSGGQLHGGSLASTNWIAQARGDRPVLVGSPRGIELLAGEECLLIALWRKVPPLAELQPMTTPGNLRGGRA
jgi:hypothetical protein